MQLFVQRQLAPKHISDLSGLMVSVSSADSHHIWEDPYGIIDDTLLALEREDEARR